jgi:hypothetical protein
LKVLEQERAISLRLEGKSLLSISKELGVSKGSVSLWVRHLPTPEKFTKEYQSVLKIKRDQVISSIKQDRVNRKCYVKEHIYEHLEEVSKTGNPLFQEVRILSGDSRWMVPAPPNYAGKKYIQDLYVYEHRLIMERSIGRLLRGHEVVHHINRDKLDNKLENLRVMSQTEHNIEHRRSAEHVVIVCTLCGVPFKREKRQFKIDNKHNFCCLSHSVSFQQKERRQKLRENSNEM